MNNICHENKNLTLEIVRLCLRVDDLAYRIYKELAARFVSEKPLKDFWLSMSEEEKNHINFWEAVCGLPPRGIGLPRIFDQPEIVVSELEVIIPRVESILERSRGTVTVDDSFLMAYRLEFYLLHPAFETLFHILRMLVNTSCPEDSYDNHIDEFFNALNKFQVTSPELELVGEAMHRLWHENKRLAKQATRDSLTNCLTRQAFNEIAIHLLALAYRKNSPVALLMMDLDHFKKINDNCGHQKGDLVLKKIADIISSSLRSSDIVGRFGGEEFIVLMPDISPEEAVNAANRILVSVSTADIENVKTTISIGIAAKDVKEPSQRYLESLVAEADKNLYKAKENGRNNIVVS